MCRKGKKEAAYAGGIPLLLSWLVAETADMVVQMGAGVARQRNLLTSSTQKGLSYSF